MTHCKAACEYFAYVKEEKIFQAVLQKWTELTDLMEVLKVLFDFTNFMQNPKLTLADMFGQWLKVERVELIRCINAGGKKSEFASILFDKLEANKCNWKL